MSNSKNVQKLTDKSRIDINSDLKLEDEGNICDTTDSSYAVTVSKKPSETEESPQCSGQKSFISIHSTDHLCQVADEPDGGDILEECNVEVISLNEVFPTTSEESLSNDEESSVTRKKSANKKPKAQQKCSKYVPTNSKSSTGPRKDVNETQLSGYSDFDIPKSTMYVTGSNPGEPKMSYQDPPKKISKTMKKFLRNIDKHKSEQGTKSGEKAISKLTTVRGILKDGRCGPECTGDSVHGGEEFSSDLTNIPNLEFWPHTAYSKHNADKNVTFNSQVIIIHFTGDLFVGQSVETLSKENDQQARNSELRKTLFTKYNESWPSNK